jgi:beta-glucanase (GH16 family)
VNYSVPCIYSSSGERRYFFPEIGRTENAVSRVISSGTLFCIAVILFLFGATPFYAQSSLANNNWQLVWSDEFNGPAGSLPDSTKWTYDVGGGGWGNNEEEVYCAAGSNASPCSTATPNAVLDGNGNLVITAYNNGGTWTSARMKTEGVENFQYGRIEARMQLPMGDGIWPAFWLLGSNINTSIWPLCGEMDIMEWVPQYGASMTSSTVHGPFSGGDGVGSSFVFPHGGTVAAFHTYGIIWSPNQAQFYRDDPNNPYFTIQNTSDIPGDWVFNHPFFVIMNLAMGGYFPGYTDSTTPNPAVMTVDYVRVYRAAHTPVAGPAAINSGGASAGSFFADTNFNGGSAISTEAAIDTSLIPAPVPPQAVYQTAREGESQYTINNLVPHAAYNVQLQFAETQYSQPGDRVFDVAINGQTVLNRFDIFAAAGGENRAVEGNFKAHADQYGNIVVHLTPRTSQKPLISGLAVTQTADNEPTSGPVSIDAGGGDVGSFIADTDFSGGNQASSFASVDTSRISAPVPPQAVFQSERWAPSTYTIGGFAPRSSHTVTLYFNEIYWTEPGQREFNVLINGNQVLTNFDIVGMTGAQNRAIEEQFPATANSSGQIVIQFTIGAADQPKVSGMAVD